MGHNTYLLTIQEHLKKAYLLPDDKIASVLPDFIDTLGQHIQNLEKNLEGGDLELLGKAGHTMRGALLNLGLKELAGTASVIEQQCEAGNLAIDYPALVTELKKELESISIQV